MKCPQCGKGIRADAKVCKHCKTRLIRKSDKLARKMTVNSAAAIACGALLMGLGVLLAYYDSLLIGSITVGVGIAMIFIGKAIK